MKLQQGTVIIADKSKEELLALLRRNSYLTSQSFKVINEEELNNYCRWNTLDDSGLVLMAINDDGVPLTTLRGNVYNKLEEFQAANKSFANIEADFCKPPILDLTFAATAYEARNTGLNSVLRFYMYVIHLHIVKTVTGVIVKDTNNHRSLERLKYEFCPVVKTSNDDEWNVAKSHNIWLNALLSINKVPDAISYLRSTYSAKIKNFPFIIE